MSERGWNFAVEWVAANVTRDKLGDLGELPNLDPHVVALRERLFKDAMRQGITPVEIEEYYDLNNYIADALNQSFR